MYDEDDYEEVEEPTGPGHELSDEILFRLSQVWTSTNRGMVDKAFPRLHAVMETKGLLERHQGGWRVTTFGREILKAQSHRVSKL